MPLVIVERRFEEPLVFEELQAKEDAVAWCLDQYDVRFVRSYASLDRLHMICVYEAPDAEAVRRTQREGTLPFDRVWTASGMFREMLGLDAANPVGDKQTVVCERTYRAPIPLSEVGETSNENRWCFETNNIELIDSYIPTDDMGSLCVFAAPDAESVRRSNRTVKLPFDRVWAATVHEPAQ